MTGKRFSDTRVGDRFGRTEQITARHLDEGARLIGDFNPLHVDDAFAARSRHGARILHGVIGIRLNGHPSFVRPLIYPMSIGAAVSKTETGEAGAVPTGITEKIKAANAASENYGNFYGQNLSPVQAGVLLVYGTMRGLGYEVSLWDLVLYTSPIVAASVIIGAIQFYRLDRLVEGAKNE